MEQQSKRRGKFALLIVTEDERGAMKQHHISSIVVEIAAIVLSLIIISGICRLIYDAITIKDAKNQIVEQIITINNLTDENEALTVENDSLTSKVTVLSETVSKKTANEDAISQETVENALPKGFPLSGSATMEVTKEGDPMLIFTASQGVNVITTGTGTVLSVDADSEYGTRIVLDHGNGYCSVYRNNGSSLVKLGEELGKGYILFSIGEDNQTLGYQIMEDEQYIDPMQMIEING